MLINFLKIAIRNIWRNPVHSFINISGLVVGLTFALLISLWIAYEESFDRFNENADNIQVLLTNFSSSEGSTQTREGTTSNKKQNILNSIPEVKAITLVYLDNRWPNEMCFKVQEDQEECVYSKGIFADSSFLKVFSYKIKEGDPNFLTSKFKIAISENLAKKLFVNEDPIGRKFKLDTWLDVEIGAIMENVPSNSTLQFDFLMPMNVVRYLRGLTNDKYWPNYSLNAYALTIPGTDPQKLSDKINNDELVVTEDDVKEGMSLMAFPLTKWHLNNRFENGKSAGGKIEYVHLFSLVALVILFMASVNYINLSTAKSSTRRKEIGVRKSIGASKVSLGVQFFGESFLLVLVSMTLAVGFVQVILPYFNHLIGQELFLNINNLQVQVILFSLLILVTLMAGLYPAFILAAFNPVKALKDKLARDITGSNFIRKTLIVVQVASSISIIIFSLVLFYQVKYIQNKNLGFDREKTIVVEPTYNLLKKYPEFRAEMLKSPFIKNTTLTNNDILNVSFFKTRYDWPGKSENEQIPFRIFAVTSDFVETFGLKLLQGTNFNNEDSTFQVLITREAAEKMHLSDPVGLTMKIQDDDARIAGVISNFHTGSLHETMSPVILYKGKATQLSHLYIKYTGTASEAISAVKSVYNKFESDFSMSYKFLDDNYDKQYRSEIVTSRVSVIFVFISLVIAVVGVIGLSVFNLTGRIKEIAIRKIFGASIPGLLQLVSKEFMYLNLIANIIAWPLAWFFARNWLNTFAYRIQMPFIDFMAIGFGMTAITLIIVGYMGFRAARQNPVDSLRYE